MKQEESLALTDPTSPSRRPKRNVSHKTHDVGNGLLWREEKEIKKALYASLHESRKSKLSEHEGGEELVKPKTKATNGESSPKKARVHAQRKFAQGSTPNSPIPTPVKMCPNSGVAVDLFPCRRPKTEDFLTFLCLRGTPILPPSLDFFNNWAKEDATSEKSYVSEADSCSKEDRGTSESNFHRQTAAKLAAIKKKLGTDAKLNSHHERLRNASSSKRKLLQDDVVIRRKPPDDFPNERSKSSVSVLKEKYKKQMLQRRNNSTVVGSNKRTCRNVVKVDVNTTINSNGKSITRSVKREMVKRASLKDEDTIRHNSNVASKKTSCAGHVKENSRKATVVTKVPVVKTHDTRRETRSKKVDIKMSLEKKQSLRSATTGSPLDNAASGVSTRVRKAKLVPPIVDIESGESDFENMDHKLLVKQVSKAIEQKTLKPIKHNSAIQQQISISRQYAFEHSYVKSPPPSAVVKSKPGPGRPSRTVQNQRKSQLVKNSLRIVGSKGKVAEVSKPFTRSSRLKEITAKTALKSTKTPTWQKRNTNKSQNDEIVRGRFRERVAKSPCRDTKKDMRSGAGRKKELDKRKNSQRELRHQGSKVKTKVAKTSDQRKQRLETRKFALLNKSDWKNVPKKTVVDSKKQKPPKLKSQCESFEKSVPSSSGMDYIKAEPKDTPKDSLKLIKEEHDDVDDYSMLTDTDEGSPKPSCLDNIESISELPTEERSLLTENSSIDNISESAAFIIENMTENVGGFEEMAAALPGELMFGSAEEIQGLMTTEFSGVFDGAILLTTRDTLSQVPLHFIPDIPQPKSMADAATNTCEEDILACMNEEANRSEETSVGTQTITPLGSPDDLAVQPSSPSVQLDKTPTKGQALNEFGMSPLKPKNKKRKSFPGPRDPPKIVEAPVYTPTLEEFQDPLEFIEKIQSEAEVYGICKIVPPASFKPECKVNDDMRFTAYNQYIHKMFQRWGPNVQHVASIRKHLSSQGISLQQAPLIGGMELDLSTLYHTVQNCGGLRQVIEKKKWHKVADAMHIPKAAQDRVNKLYDTYCKYLVSYDTLPEEEKDRLEQEVIVQHQHKMEQKLKQSEEDDDDEGLYECVAKGRSIALSGFYRIARNTMSMWYRSEPTTDEVERDYWKLVSERERHVVVHAGNIDSSVYGSGFPTIGNRGGLFCKHPWNLKVLTNNPGSLLRSMGPVSGVTIPTLHVGMLYTTGCWYRDPHELPWIEYLHTGANKIWYIEYGIPASTSKKFGDVMREVMPRVCTDNPIWLPSDTAMLPPDLLVEHDVSLSRTVQESGQFVVIFPGAFTSSICTGYIVSESVYFAPPWWLDSAKEAFQEIEDSCEPPMFSLERLLFSIASDSRSQPETLQKLVPHLLEIRERELSLRQQLSELGLKQLERVHHLEVRDGKRRRHRGLEDNDLECEVCRTQCYISMVTNTQDESVYCLKHCCQYIRKKKSVKSLKLFYTHDEDDLNDIIEKVTEQIHLPGEGKSPNKKKPKKKSSP